MLPIIARASLGLLLAFVVMVPAVQGAQVRFVDPYVDEPEGTPWTFSYDGPGVRTGRVITALQRGPYMIEDLQISGAEPGALVVRLHSLHALVVLGAVDANGSFELQTPTAGCFWYCFIQVYVPSARSRPSGNDFRPFTLERFAAAGTSALPSWVPEPQLWALMIVGFGAVGAQVRRERRERTVA